MRLGRVAWALAAGALSGCAGSAGPAWRQAVRPVATAPQAGAVASLLPAAGEGEWRPERDVGPLDFDDGGLPVVRAGAQPAKQARKRFLGLSLGSVMGARYDETSDNFDAESDGPHVGAFLSLPWKCFALEMGYDVLRIKEYDTGWTYYSDVTYVRGPDLVLYLGRTRGKVKLYVGYGRRSVSEETELWIDGFPDALNESLSSSGSGIVAGIAFGAWDIRYESVDAEADGEDDMGLDLESLSLAVHF